MNGLTLRAVVWIAIQIAPLLLGISAAPLWARYAPPREHATLALLASVQILSLATLRRWLLAGFESCWFVMLSAILMLLLATIAANQSISTWLACSVGVIAWIVTLFAITRFKKPAINAWIDLIATLLATILICLQIASRLL